MVVPSAVHATFEKLFPIKIAVINLEGLLNSFSMDLTFSEVSFSNHCFNRIRLMAVKAVSVDEKYADNKMNKVKMISSK